MNILITNDDGIQSEGIKKLAIAAKKYGQVTVVAPDSQRSAMSHSINLRDPIRVFEYDFPVEGVIAYASSGTPADCVRVACRGLMDSKPDIVLSGINLGYNAGTDVQYSATIGAAMEGIFQGVPSIAFSEGFSEIGHRTTDKYLDEIMDVVMSMEKTTDYVINVNFPDCDIASLKGVLTDRINSKDCVYEDFYKCTPLPDGSMEFMVDGHFHDTAEAESDLRALFDGYISIGNVYNIGR